jgi:hypothetical protein
VQRKNYIIILSLIIIISVGVYTVTLQNKEDKLSIIDKINDLSLGKGDRNATSFPKLIELESKFNNDEIIALIKSDKYTDSTKHLLIELYFHKNDIKNKEKGKLKVLLNNKSISKNLKQTIIANVPLDIKDEQLILEIIKNDDTELAFWSLKRYYEINEQKAFDVASDILNQKRLESNPKTLSALKIYARYLGEHKDIKNYKDLEANFITKSKNIMQDSTDKQASYTALFSMSDLKSKEGILLIINDKGISNEDKVGAIDQNFMVLKEILQNNPSEAEFSAVLTAMKIFPINDLIVDIENAAGSIKDKKLVIEAESVVTFIEQNGTNANYKWLDKNEEKK